MASPYLSYEPVEAIANSDEDWPGPRCGHTLSPIFTSNSQQLVLFGGTNIGDSFSGINLAGVTNSVHCFDLSTRRWRRLDTCGYAPSPRACHAAATSRTYLLIRAGHKYPLPARYSLLASYPTCFSKYPHCSSQGGINLGGPCDENVYVLDIASNDHRWRRLMVEGMTPGPRYGHVMGIASERWLVIFGGMNGNAILSDTWALDLSGTSEAPTPFTWHRLNPSGNLPSGRMYASACIGESGAFLLFGGRDRLGRPLGDAYGLVIFSITQCVWTTSNSGVAPSPRYQHSAVYDGTRMHVIGGVWTWNNLVDREAIVAVLNTQTGEWLETNQPENSAVRELQYQLMRRSLHAAASIGGRIYVYGGRRSADILLEDFLVNTVLANGH